MTMCIWNSVLPSPCTRRSTALAWIFAFSLAPLVFAQEGRGKADPQRDEQKSAANPVERNKPATISVEQERSILAFVSTHDAPLHGLLGNLRISRPLEYQKALLDLMRVTDRLAQVKRNRPHAYDLEVKKWQAQSKVQMLAAQLATSPNPEIRVKLRQAIAARADLELEVLKADQEATAKRLKQLDEQIAAAEAAKENRIQQQFERTLAASRRARAAKASEGPKKRPDSDAEAPTQMDAKKNGASTTTGRSEKSSKGEGASP
jgi:hypothetical protein